MFVPTSVPIGLVVHAVALSEHRTEFNFTNLSTPGVNVVQVGFRGAHLDIGGGYGPLDKISNITLHWMMYEAKSIGWTFSTYYPALSESYSLLQVNDSYLGEWDRGSSLAAIPARFRQTCRAGRPDRLPPEHSSHSAPTLWPTGIRTGTIQRSTRAAGFIGTFWSHSRRLSSGSACRVYCPGFCVILEANSVNYPILFNIIIVPFLLSGCHRDNYFEFGVYNTSGADLTDVAVIFSDSNGEQRIGVLGSTGLKSMTGLSGPVPASADVTWSDKLNVAHRQHVKITPLPAPTATSYNGSFRSIYFRIEPDGSVKFVNHDPRFPQ